MRESFDRALSFTLKWEGGYSFDPQDPGGETNLGINKRHHPYEDIKNMTRERAAVIYLEDYWTLAGCDEIIFPDDVAVFDSAVNCGVSRAKKWYWSTGDWASLLVLRQTYYRKLADRRPVLKKYLNGWLNRINDLARQCKEWEVMG
jgi:hypothetical protein